MITPLPGVTLGAEVPDPIRWTAGSEWLYAIDAPTPGGGTGSPRPIRPTPMIPPKRRPRQLPALGERQPAA